MDSVQAIGILLGGVGLLLGGLGLFFKGIKALYWMGDQEEAKKAKQA